MAASPRLILASQSPRRRQLLQQSGYEFDVMLPHEAAECGVCSRETPPELVCRLAYQKAQDVARRCASGLILGCDTVAECSGQILGKPVDRDHAAAMLKLLRGRTHHVFSGLCLWSRPDDRTWVDVDVTTLTMDSISDDALHRYLDSDAWVGKAGAFGYQDDLDWVHVVSGSESNVVGLPLERLAQLLRRVQQHRGSIPPPE
jgi:septum formation protein